MIFFFLSSGLFLGWSLGANDAGNAFGTAVGTRMIKFRVAAIICSVFVVLGACIGGSGTTSTIRQLGTVDTLPSAFIIALSSGLVVFWMTKYKLPVSSSQAIVGAIIGYNLFTSNPTNPVHISKIVSSWVTSPILAGVFAVLLYIGFKKLLNNVKMHLLVRDQFIRYGFWIAGAFGAYSLGANNIANVTGVFAGTIPFTDLHFGRNMMISGQMQLLFLGGISIALGVMTYSKKVMYSIGSGIFKLNPEMGLIIVISQSLVLFLFSSNSLQNWLVSNGLPSFPLVPVSSSQAVVGAILGIGIYKSAKGIKYNLLGHIGLGWILTPVLAGVITFFSLFFLQNVFKQEIFNNHPVEKRIAPDRLLTFQSTDIIGISTEKLVF